MRANLSFGDQLELSLRAQLELSRDQLEASKAQLELARGDTVTEAACTDYTCAVKIIPAWVGILILTFRHMVLVMGHDQAAAGSNAISASI